MFASTAVVSCLCSRYYGRAGLLILLVSVCVGCSTDACIHVDNGGRQQMVVTVDGKEEATIPPGEAKLVRCPPGEHRFHVRCGEQVQFDGIKDLKPSVGHVFNPDGRNRYWIYTVKYGSSRLEGLVESVLTSTVEDHRSEIQKAYQELLADVELLPSDSWFEVPTGARYVLRKPPEAVLTKHQMEKHKVLWRMAPSDYATIQAARRVKNPTEKDLEALDEAIERVWEATP